MSASTAAETFDLDTMVEDLRTLVEVESPSRHLVELERSAEVLSGLIERRLGGTCTLVESDAGPHVHWRGGDDPRVLLLGHHDTVFPLGTLAERPFVVTEDGHAMGPGVFDMAAGIVQAIHAVASLEDRSGCELLFSADEEVGSRASKDLIIERARACGNALVFEGSADGGLLKTGRKGTGTFEVTVTGRASHAGLDPEKGINALVEAAHQVLEITTFGRSAAGTTVTPTVASAGTADNVVPATARISVDVRVESVDEKDRVEAAMAALTAVVDGATVDVRGGIGRPPMPESASTELFALAKRVAPWVEGAAVGGGSDGNFTAAAGVPTLDGMGAVGGGAHADHEWVVIETMPERARLAADVIRELQAEPQVPARRSTTGAKASMVRPATFT